MICKHDIHAKIHTHTHTHMHRFRTHCNITRLGELSLNVCVYTYLYYRNTYTHTHTHAHTTGCRCVYSVLANLLSSYVCVSVAEHTGSMYTGMKLCHRDNNLYAIRVTDKLTRTYPVPRLYNKPRIKVHHPGLLQLKSSVQNTGCEGLSALFPIASQFVTPSPEVRGFYSRGSAGDIPSVRAIQRSRGQFYEYLRALGKSDSSNVKD